MPSETTVLPAVAMDDLDVVASVTGCAHYATEDIDRTVTFNMYKYSDGTVEGWYHGIGRGREGANIRVRIECLHVVGNEAWANGTVVAAAAPDNIGRPYTLHMIDNGEGAQAEPDRVGIYRFQYFDCEAEPDPPLREVTVGNLQVRG